jgi:hypothetical protein
MPDQNQKQQEQSSQDSRPRDSQRITQNKPSHMNQGNQTFRPDQQKKQNPDEGCNESGKEQESGDRARKAS